MLHSEPLAVHGLYIHARVLCLFPTSCKMSTKTFRSKRLATEFINSCALLRKFDTSALKSYLATFQTLLIVRTSSCFLYSLHHFVVVSYYIVNVVQETAVVNPKFG